MDGPPISLLRNNPRAPSAVGCLPKAGTPGGGRVLARPTEPRLAPECMLSNTNSNPLHRPSLSNSTPAVPLRPLLVPRLPLMQTGTTRNSNRMPTSMYSAKLNPYIGSVCMFEHIPSPSIPSYADSHLSGAGCGRACEHYSHRQAEYLIKKRFPLGFHVGGKYMLTKKKPATLEPVSIPGPRCLVLVELQGPNHVGHFVGFHVRLADREP